MTQEEQQELDQITQKFIERNEQEFQDLQNEYQQKIQENNSTQTVQMEVQQPSVDLSSTKATMSTIGVTLIFIILLVMNNFKIRRTQLKKDESKIAELKYRQAKISRIIMIAAYAVIMINNYYSGEIVNSVIIVGVLVVIYLILAKVKNFISKSNTVKNSESGIVLGAANNQMIVKPSTKSGHVLVVGGSGKGKSQCVTIPTLLNWEGSALVVDIKRELYAYTHNVRENKGKVIVFDPEQNGHRYNPIRECETVDSCQFLARTLIPTPPKADPFWTGNAQNVLAAACFEGYRKGQTLPEIAERILTTDPLTLVDELTGSPYREAALLCSSVKGTPEKTLGGIFTELKGKMITLATDPNIRQALSDSEWTPSTLEEGATIYLRVSERQIETYKPVWSLIVVQILRYLSGRQEHKDPAILLLLDELPRLGKVEGYSSSLPTLRSKNVHIVSAIQSLAQLQEHYGKEVTRTIMDNKAYKLVLSASDNETQKVFSDLAGKAENKKRSTNVSFGGGGISEYKQWEERFRPENFAYLTKPIYYPPDQPAFEVEKLFWMNIPALLKLQKDNGGPIGFLSPEEIEIKSHFYR